MSEILILDDQQYLDIQQNPSVKEMANIIDQIDIGRLTMQQYAIGYSELLKETAHAIADHMSESFLSHDEEIAENCRHLIQIYIYLHNRLVREFAEGKLK